MLLGLVIKCGFKVVYEASICTIYSCSNVFSFFARSEIVEMSLNGGKKLCKIFPGSLILSKVFLHSILHRSSKVVSPKVSSASQYDTWGG